jgi:CHAT domain-containing protein
MKNIKILYILLSGLLTVPLVIEASGTSEQSQIPLKTSEISIKRLQAQLNAVDLTPQQRIKVFIDLAKIYQETGDYSASQTYLQQALALSESQPLTIQRILIYSALGDTALVMQQPDVAQAYLAQGLTLARQIDDATSLAHILNNLGNVLSVQRQYAQALATYAEAMQWAERADDMTLQIQIVLNQLRIALRKQETLATIDPILTTILTKIHQYPLSSAKGFHLLSLSQLLMKVSQRFHRADDEQHIYALLTATLDIAKTYQHKRLQAYAKGYLGQLYEQAKRYEEALQLTREAIFFSQQLPELLYRWEWQRGRLLQAQQDLISATAAYQKALFYLKPIRTGLILEQRDAQDVFQERIRPVYFELADILLQRAAQLAPSLEKSRLLNQTKETLEQLKAAELQNYFQDECVSNTRITQLDSIDKQTAVLYPVLLPDRMELLVSLPDGIHQIIVPIPAQQLTETVLTFQTNLQTRTHFRFLKQAKQLYDWLIAPIYDQLITHHINTLVIVPDGPLRMIPMAALHDGEKYLIQTFAIATTPGLNLTDPRPLPRTNIKVLLGGLSEGVQNFSPLPNVPEEIDSISTLFNRHVILFDETFLLNKMQQIVRENTYAIVHIASHGQFDRNPKKTFLLTYDDKLTMDHLESLFGIDQINKEPVELLTLSACQTATGDEQSALGLAGVAIKAGARSALASLWFVSDESTAYLIKTFYQQLQDTRLSKAQALQKAQQILIRQQTFRHPVYWAAFLLIGNWL